MLSLRRRPIGREDSRMARHSRNGVGLSAARGYARAVMTKALQKAFEVASKLPDHAQDELAAAILDELRADVTWEKTLGSSLPELERLAEEALREHRAGRTRPLDPDDL
jgi:hypothetical protein